MNKGNRLNENVLEFKLREGKDSGTPGTNWLREMKNGTRFLAFRKGTMESMLHDFIVASDPKAMDAVLLGENHGIGGEFRFRDPDKFIREYDCFMILEVVELKDGNSNQVQEGTVEGDGGPEGPPSLPKEE